MEKDVRSNSSAALSYSNDKLGFLCITRDSGMAQECACSKCSQSNLQGLFWPICTGGRYGAFALYGSDELLSLELLYLLLFIYTYRFCLVTVCAIVSSFSRIYEKIIFLCLLCHRTFAHQSLLFQVRVLPDCFLCEGDKHNLGCSELRMMKLILISVYAAVMEYNGAIMRLR